ncbi:SRPBCC family protein [Leifsonia shinshuensis]|uniref:SRPBCC family protein n=1 Tax=Leifsonia shinshuensis TaxID=150026 RepID=UPI001F504503|nr:SRPBCC family protein [Leifsonia shinshuensis]MCI0157214.1 SRPBCC family protein [Leifsonia shinshuensis]
MAAVTESIDVDVPVTTAYNQWTQLESFPRFLEEVDEIRQVDDTTNHWRVTIGGATREFDTVITEQHPDERIAWKSVAGDVAHAGVVTFHRLSDTSTRVTVQFDWTPGSVLEKAGAVLGVDDHAVMKDLHNFKTYIEDQPVETGSWRGEVDPGDRS